MNQFAIDKNIPLPLKARSRSKYPFSQMEIHDSFFIPGATNNSRSSIYYGAKMANVKVATSLSTERNINSLRVWRTA